MDPVRPDARAWFEERTTAATSLADLDPAGLLRAKRRGGHRVSVVLPARNEEATVGRLVGCVREHWVDGIPLVDELVVIDSDSTDGTAAAARAAGADVGATTDILPEHGTRPGKGEALWKSLAATTGDLVVFLDADLLGDVTHYVPGLLAPLLNALWPELAGVIQPLGGEYAGRRSALEQVPFVSAYGVEVGLLVDLLRLGGLSSLAQVDLGLRRHTSQPIEALGEMAGQVVATVLARAACARQPSGLLTRFRHDGTGFVPHSSPVAVDERPPMVTVPEYLARLAG